MFVIQAFSQGSYSQQSYLKLADSLFQFQNYRSASTYYQKAINQLMNTKGFDVKQMLSKIQSRQSLIVKCTTVDGALKQLADIYNYKIQSGRILFIGAGNKIEDIIIR